MRHLVPILIREFACLARECAKWTLVGVMFLFCLWFLTHGLPRLVVAINGQTPASVIHSATSQRDLTQP